jgi:type III restriction enzyme
MEWVAKCSWNDRPSRMEYSAGGTTLALEIKGTDSPQNKAKRDALNEWVKAINAAGGFGRWTWDVAFKPSEVQDIITKHAAVAEPAE